MGIMDIGLITSIVGNGVYGYAMASGMLIEPEWHAMGIMNYLATPVALFGNGVCNMPDEHGRGPVDYANSEKRNGMTISKDKDGQVHYHSISGKPTKQMSNLEVGLAQGTFFLIVNSLALGVGAGVGLLTKTVSGN